MNEGHGVKKSPGKGVAEAEESFASRWSRRKLEGSDAQPEEDSGALSSLLQGQAGPEPERERVISDQDLAPPESLSDDDDFSGFLSPDVSEALRQKALQRLFSAARFNVVDGLDDYAEDFTQFAPLGEVVTHEMRRLLEDRLDQASAAGDRPRREDERDAANPEIGPEIDPDLVKPGPGEQKS
jgi:hypothetical protein